MARLLFWGTHGVRRDLERAAFYYQMGAENGDPQAMHDYGIVLLKVSHCIHLTASSLLQLSRSSMVASNVVFRVKE